MWKHYEEDDGAFSTMAMLSVLLSIVSVFYRHRIVLLAAVFCYIVSLPLKKKEDLALTNVLFAGFASFMACIYAYLMSPDAYD